MLLQLSWAKRFRCDFGGDICYSNSPGCNCQSRQCAATLRHGVNRHIHPLKILSNTVHSACMCNPCLVDGNIHCHCLKETTPTTAGMFVSFISSRGVCGA